MRYYKRLLTKYLRPQRRENRFMFIHKFYVNSIIN